MPKVAQTHLDEFGRAVKRARSLKGWTLDELATAMAGNPKEATGKSFLSNIEKGKRDISARTVGKLIATLSLSEDWIDRFLDADVAPEAEETRTDREADRLLRLVAQDETAPPTAEALLMALAETWAQKYFTDPTTAYNALRGALQAAQDMKDQIDRLHNLDDRLAAVLRRVAEMNDRGETDAAGKELDAAIKAKEAEIEALQDAALQQDRLRNDATSYAKRLVNRLRAAAPPGGVFKATVDLLIEWKERGERQGDPFDLAVALALARINHDRAKGPQVGQALLSLGNCHLAIGDRQSGNDHLTRAIKAYTAALKEVPRRSRPKDWATTQNNLGNALQSLGDREGDTARLHEAVAAYRVALQVRTRDAAPMDWAMTQNNLGNALQSLGNREGDTARLHEAIAAHRAVLQERTRDAAPMDWATTQNNLGVALQSLGEREGDTARLHEAIAAYRAALQVRTRDAAPMDWATTQHNLAIVHLSLARLEQAPEHLDLCEAAFSNARNVRSPDTAPYLWADSHGGMGKVAKARFDLTGDRAQLGIARRFFIEARAIFALDPENRLARECDDLLAQIDAAENP